MPKYLVETVSIFRMVYAVEANEESHALDEVTMHTTGGPFDENWNEMSQQHVAENIVSSREVSEEEYLAEFDKNNAAWCGSWTNESKMKLINKIDYDKP